MTDTDGTPRPPEDAASAAPAEGQPTVDEAASDVASIPPELETSAAIEAATVEVSVAEVTVSGTVRLDAPDSVAPAAEVEADVVEEIAEDAVDAAPPASTVEEATPLFVRARRRLLVTAPAVTLTALVTGVFLMFVLIEPSPRWVVLFGTAVSTLALAGVLRAGRREAFAEGRLDTTPHLLVPALYVLTMPVFLEHNSIGYFAPLGALAAALGYGALVTGALSSIREYDPGRVLGRFLVTAATYVVAFAMFSLVFLFGVERTPATLAAGLAATLLAAEILREGEIDPGETLLYSVVTGIIVAETRWLLHFVPAQGYAAALTLLLAFYLTTGLLHSHVVRQLTRRVAVEYASVGAAGVAFITGLRLAGLA
jgi:hypothetical protein